MFAAVFLLTVGFGTASAFVLHDIFAGHREAEGFSPVQPVRELQEQYQTELEKHIFLKKPRKSSE